MLLGRKEERLALDRLFAQARAGRSGVLALVGEPGIGKSTLLDHAAECAEGMWIVRARGIESEAVIPFAGLAELLRPLLGALERIPQPQARALAGALALGPARPRDRFAIGAATLSLLTASAPERRQAHAALASALGERDPDRRAWHMASASVGLDDDASAALEQAGARAHERSAYAVASAAFEQAAERAAALAALHDSRRASFFAAMACGIAFVANGRGQAGAESARQAVAILEVARAERCRALLADAGEMEPCFEEALRLHELTPDVFEAARTRLAYGARLRRARGRIRAREQLRDALASFERLGAQSWADQAHVELAASGETARRRDASTLDDLTPQELRIARLLAEGRTTRETAATIFVSPKTVEYHLRHIYAKLGIHSREELGAALQLARTSSDRRDHDHASGAANDLSRQGSAR
jgi:DNA-binding CsgD family transcriptional regulator